MSCYGVLVKKALKSITHTCSQRTAEALLAKCDGKLSKTSESPAKSEEDYELLTGLVILQSTGQQ